MNSSDCYKALSYLIEKYIDDPEAKEVLEGELASDKSNRERPPAKHYLSEFNRHTTAVPISEEDGELIKEIAFHYL